MPEGHAHRGGPLPERTSRGSLGVNYWCSPQGGKGTRCRRWVVKRSSGDKGLCSQSHRRLAPEQRHRGKGGFGVRAGWYQPWCCTALPTTGYVSLWHIYSSVGVS